MALRRWKPFLGAFVHIDAAIEAGAAAISRDEFRSARGPIVEMLCDADDDGFAEELCLLLDDAMAESLVTLRTAVPTAAARPLLASGGLAGAVGALMNGHDSELVRGLARDVLRRWRAAVEEELATARAAMGVLDALPSSRALPPPEAKKPAAVIIPEKKTVSHVVTDGGRATANTAKKMPLVVRGGCVKNTHNSEAASTEVTVPAPPRKQGKKTAAASACSGEGNKMETTKRMLQGRYQEAEDAKRRRTIQVVVAPEMPRQGRRQAR
ncbi:hypothetical protein ACP4OV_005971 [Aristida adscensionis]